MSEYRYFVDRADAVIDKVPSFVSILNEVFPNYGMSDELFRWKHIDNPYGPSIVGWCDNSLGETVGFRALWAQALTYNRRRYLAFQPCDTATRKEFRGVGVSSRLVDKCMGQVVESGGAAIFNFPNENSLRLYLKMDWAVQKGIRRFVRVNSFGKILSCIQDVREKFVPQLRRIEGASLIDFGDFDYVPNDHLVSVHVDQSVLDWRFNRHPRFEYGAVRSDTNDLAIFRRGRRGRIEEAELVFVGGAKPGALRRVSSVLSSKKAIDCISIVKNDRTPVSVGFIPLPSNINFVRRGIVPELASAAFDLQPMQIDVT